MVVARAQILALPQRQLSQDELSGAVVLERPGTQLQTTTAAASTTGSDLKVGNRAPGIIAPGSLIGRWRCHPCQYLSYPIGYTDSNDEKA